MSMCSPQIGPAIVYLTWHSAFGKGAFLHSVSPCEPLTQILLHEVYGEWCLPTVLAKLYLRSELLQSA